MARKSLIANFLILFLLAAAAAILAVAPLTGTAHSRRVYALPQLLPTWQQVNTNGFGDPQHDEVTALAAFDGYLYAGTHNATDPAVLVDGAQIFRSADGESWSAVTDPGFGNSHDTAPPAILDLEVFGSYLYASTGRGDDAGKIFRTLDGTNWAPVVNSGFADPDTVEIGALSEFNGQFYAGAKNLVSGAQVWRSPTGDSNTWTQVAPVVPGTEPAGVTALAAFDGGLYAAVESAGPAQIWRTFGGDWSTVVGDGFGDADTTFIGSLAAFAGYLYAGTGNAGGAQLYRTADGDTWVPAATPGTADANNEQVEMLFVFENRLYAGLANASTGLEIWRTADGLAWEQVNADGFGDAANTTTNGSHAAAIFLGRLYTGTANAAGGELWRMQSTYDLLLSPDQEKVGTAGQDITYTLWITNTGTMTDTVDLAAAGQSWTTALSAASVANLAPAAAASFDVTVTIPPGAAARDVDAVTITATSQGDNSKSAAAVLTTTTVSALVCGITAGTPYELAGLGLTVTAVGTDLDCAAVSHIAANHPNAPPGIQTGHYWMIDGLQSDQGSPVTPDFTFNLTLPHTVLSPALPYVCKYPGGLGGAGWDCARTGSDAATVWRDGITNGFSDWAVGVDVDPTAVRLASFSAFSVMGHMWLFIVLFALLAALTIAWRLATIARR